MKVFRLSFRLFLRDFALRIEILLNLLRFSANFNYSDNKILACI